MFILLSSKTLIEFIFPCSHSYTCISLSWFYGRCVTRLSQQLFLYGVKTGHLCGLICSRRATHLLFY